MAALRSLSGSGLSYSLVAARLPNPPLPIGDTGIRSRIERYITAAGGDDDSPSICPSGWQNLLCGYLRAVLRCYGRRSR